MSRGYISPAIIVTVTTSPIVPAPVVSPLVLTDPEYVDLVAQAVSRLCEYAKRKSPI